MTLTLNIIPQKFILLIISMFLVLMGMLSTDTAMDRGFPTTRMAILFVIGWIGIAAILSMNFNPVGVTMQNFLYRGIPALLILGAAVYAQRAIRRSKSEFITAGIMFAIAWGLLVLGNSAIQGKGWTFDTTKLILLSIGATLIVIGLVFITLNRKYNFRTQKIDGPGNVYDIGFPLFIMGWMAIITGLSLK